MIETPAGGKTGEPTFNLCNSAAANPCGLAATGFVCLGLVGCSNRTSGNEGVPLQ